MRPKASRKRVVRWKSRSKPDWFSVRNLTLQAYAIAGHHHSTSAPRRECDGGWVGKKSSTTFPKKNAKKRKPEPSTKTVKHPQTGGAVKEGPRLNEIHRNSDCENQENPLLWLRLASIRRIILEVSSIRGIPPNHPLIDGIFPYKPSSYWGTPIFRNPPESRECTAGHAVGKIGCFLPGA